MLTQEVDKLVLILGKVNTHLPLRIRAKKALEAMSRAQRFDTLPPHVKTALSEALFDDVMERFLENGAQVRLSLLNLNEILESMSLKQKLAQGILPPVREIGEDEVEVLVQAYLAKHPGGDERIIRRHNWGRQIWKRGHHE